MRVKLTELTQAIEQALVHYGYDEQERGQISEILLYAQLRGNNQGIAKLIGSGMPKNPNAEAITVIRETSLSALLDGGQNAGMVVNAKAADMAIAKAKSAGFGMVGTRNTSTSTGAIGYYARKIAEADCLGFAFAGSPETVTMHGSYAPLFGTNPLAIGIPTIDTPVVFDMATAAMAFYGLVEAQAAKRSIPGDVAYDAEGNLTQDPGAAMDGAILPFDRGYKGAGLAMMVEILTGPLVMAAFTGAADSWTNWGNLVIAIDPKLMVDLDQFKQEVSTLVKRVKSAKRLPGVDEIYTPGERGDRLHQAALDTGEVEIDDELYSALCNVGTLS
jgi:L-2-hydroxycarboxylate dehydrogenase (NAD+)